MKKRVSVFCLLAIIFACSFIFTGCSSTNDGTNEESTSVTTDDANAAVYNVTLDPNGGVFPDGTTEAVTVEVKDGTAVDFQSYMATMEGNELRGWYQKDATSWPGAKKVTGDLMLKAKWSKEEVKEIYPLILTLAGEEIPLSSDSGIYQFTVVSSIHGGYAQRSGMYTINMEDLQAAIDADNETQKRALIKIESNYVDATGIVYGIIYNDGTIELYYDYEHAGKQTQYVMDTVKWTLEGYNAPFEAETEMEEEGVSAHSEYDRSSIAGDADTEESEEESNEESADIVTFTGDSFVSFDATESETMKLQFCGNGVAAIYMTTYETYVDTKYLWSYDEENGLVIHYNGGEENVVNIAEDGDTCSLSDEFENSYEFSLKTLVAAIPERVECYRAAATNSKTMFTFFYEDNGIGLMYDMTSNGMEGQFYTTASGQWVYDEENGLQIAINGQLIELTENADGNLEYKFDGNTYAISQNDLLAATN